MTTPAEETNPPKKPWYKKKRFIIPLSIFAIAVALSPSSEESSTTSSSTTQQTSENATESVETEQETSIPEYGNYPSAQKDFIRIVEEARGKIDDAETELQESVALRQRDKDLCAVLDGRTATNWTGKITKVGANGEGKAHVEIELADDIRVMTWNNAFSDINDNTLISPNASFFDDLVAMPEDTTVTWSGRFLAGNNFCLKKANLTNLFYGKDPQFIVRFTDIKAAK